MSSPRGVLLGPRQHRSDDVVVVGSLCLDNRCVKRVALLGKRSGERLLLLLLRVVLDDRLALALVSVGLVLAVGLVPPRL